MKKIFILFSILFVIIGNVSQTFAEVDDRANNPDSDLISPLSQKDSKVPPIALERTEQAEPSPSSKPISVSINSDKNRTPVSINDNVQTSPSATPTPEITQSRNAVTQASSLSTETSSHPTSTKAVIASQKEEQGDIVVSQIKSVQADATGTSYPTITGTTDKNSSYLYKSSVLSRERTTSFLGIALLFTLLGTVLLIPPIPLLNWTKFKNTFSFNSQSRSHVIVEFPSSNY